MKKLMFAAFLLFSAAPGFSILSPLNQSSVEIQKILQSKESQDYLPQNETISEIHRTENGYLLKTQKWKLLVEVKYVPSERMGPQQFKLISQKAHPIN